MVSPSINPDLCTGCGICLDECGGRALEMTGDVVAMKNPDECRGCGTCAENCPSEAVIMI